MVTMTTADNVLKSYYLPAISDTLNYESNPFLAKIKQTTSDVWGRDVRKVVRAYVSGGIGAGTETGELPVAGANTYRTLTGTLKNLYGTIQISDKALRASANSEGAFVNLLNDEMESLVKTANFNFSRMLFGESSGKMAKLTNAGENSIHLDTSVGFVEGMIIDVVGADGTMKEEGKTIMHIDRTSNRLNFTQANSFTFESGDFVCMHGSYGLELTGLADIFNKDKAKLYGLNRVDYVFLEPYVVKNVGEITQNAIQKAIDKIEECSGGHTDIILCSWGVKRALAELFAANGRNIDTMELKGGYRAMSFNGIPVVADRFCPKGTMYLLDSTQFGLHQLCDWQWLEGEDGKVLKQIPGKPVYTATLVKYAELMCYNPAAQAMLTGITEA